MPLYKRKFQAITVAVAEENEGAEANPTLKRAANNHCAYGVSDGLVPA